ncbi:MAG: hypothetical protein P8K77_05420 [Polaribacter sp.]|nr:hypothetical protein [Polaribacter sp.]
MAGLKIALFMKTLKKCFAKKLEGSSLTETIVATILILIVFVITTASLNNILKNTLKRDTTAVEGMLNEFIYTYRYQKTQLPTTLEQGDWIIEIQHKKVENVEMVFIEATHKESKKKISKKIIRNEN